MALYEPHSHRVARKGLHTVQAVREGDRPASAKQPVNEDAAHREDVERMKKYLQQLQQGREKGEQ